MQKEDEMMKRRLLDLAERAFQKNTYTYSNFLSSADQVLLTECAGEFAFIPHQLFGGVEGSERQMVAFGSEELFGYAPVFPLVCLQIKPLAVKFSEDLNHRDVLGALMNLGIERDVLGDIMLRDKSVYLFCIESMVDYIQEKLTRIRHTSVLCEVMEEIPDYLKPQLKEEHETVASLRLDVVVAAAYNLSRSKSYTLLTEQKIAVNGRVNENRSHVLKQGDIISVRGYGKFVLSAVLGETRKGKLSIMLSKYVS